jgi:hypothetical protein
MTDECLNIFDEFGAVSGSKLNREKTIGLVMNDIKIYDNEINSGVNLTMGPVNVLGIPVGKNMANDFWDTLIAKIKKKLSMWQHRNLSLCGKVQIIKSLGMSKLLFASNFLSVDDSVIRKVENLFYDYLWDGKKTRVKKEICILPKKLGGISMIDVRLALKVQNIKWIKRLLLAEEDDDWAVIPLRNIRCLDRKFGVELFSLQVNDARNILKTVTLDRAYKEWLDDYQEFMRKSDKKLNDDILWCNKDIKFNGKPLEFAHWAKSGILYVRDVVNNGIINEPYIFERLIHKASFYFDISRLKASIPQNLLMKNYTDQNTFANTSQNIILNTQLTLSDGKICSFNDMTSKDLYNVFLEKNRCEIKSKVYWQYKFTDMNLNFDVWYSCNFTNWLIPRKCLDFNWRFFHGKINTEARLSKMRLSNGFCIICKDKPENLEHLLFDCKELSTVWNRISDDIHTLQNKIDKFIVLAGVLEENVNARIVNMVVSICRWIVWKRRNLMKYENNYLTADQLYRWMKYEIRCHEKTLLHTNKIYKEDKLRSELHKLTETFGN